MTENAIGKQVVDAAYKLHAMIGSGLVETVYRDLLACELTRRNLKVVRQLPVPLFYEGIHFQNGFQFMLVNDKVIVEITSIEQVASIHKKQLLTYLKLTEKRLGLLINFNVELIKNGISRVMMGLDE